jgi:hypothetical protein
MPGGLGSEEVYLTPWEADSEQTEWGARWMGLPEQKGTDRICTEVRLWSSANANIELGG